jgi:hypothetical protein
LFSIKSDGLLSYLIPVKAYRNPKGFKEEKKDIKIAAMFWFLLLFPKISQQKCRLSMNTFRTTSHRKGGRCSFFLYYWLYTSPACLVSFVTWSGIVSKHRRTVTEPHKVDWQRQPDLLHILLLLITKSSKAWISSWEGTYGNTRLPTPLRRQALVRICSHGSSRHLILILRWEVHG